MKQFLAALLCLAAVWPAAGAETKGAAKTAAPAATATPGNILIGLTSAPVLTARRVRTYEYGVTAVRVSNTAQYMKQVCDTRFELVDAFITYLHGKPFTTGAEVDGGRAQIEMLQLAKKISGDFVQSVEVSWSKAPRPVEPAIFPNVQTVACK